MEKVEMERKGRCFDKSIATEKLALWSAVEDKEKLKGNLAGTES